MRDTALTIEQIDPKTVRETAGLTPAEMAALMGMSEDGYTAWEAGSGGWYWRHENLVELCLVPQSVPAFLFDDFRGNPSSQLDWIRHRPAVLVEDPSTPVRVVEWGQLTREVEVEALRSGTLMWRVIWFPGMQVSVDGARVESFRDERTGLLIHELNQGDHLARWSWKPFPALRRARWISLIAVVTVIVLYGASRVRRSARGGRARA